MKLDYKDFPFMQTFVAEYSSKLPANCVDRSLMSNIANEAISVNPHILRTFGVDITILTSIFLKKFKHAEFTYGNPDLEEYYLNSEERILREKELYQRDEKGRIWFSYDAEDLVRDSGMCVDDIIDGVSFLIGVGTLDIFEETHLNETKLWYTFYNSAYYGMTMYSVWVEEEYYVEPEEEDEKDDS